MSMDWLPTLTGAAGRSPELGKPLDGVDLLPMLKGDCVLPERGLYWRSRDQGAVRQGPWKYITGGPMEFLFNVVDDPREQANLKLREAQRFEARKRQYADWQRTMLHADTPALRELLDESLVYIHSTGERDTRSSDLDRLDQGLVRYDKLESLITGVQSSERFALVWGKMDGHIQLPDCLLTVQSRYEAVWMQLMQRWVLVALQSSLDDQAPERLSR